MLGMVLLPYFLFHQAALPQGGGARCKPFGEDRSWTMSYRCTGCNATLEELSNLVAMEGVTLYQDVASRLLSRNTLLLPSYDRIQIMRNWVNECAVGRVTKTRARQPSRASEVGVRGTSRPAL